MSRFFRTKELKRNRLPPHQMKTVLSKMVKIAMVGQSTETARNMINFAVGYINNPSSFNVKTFDKFRETLQIPKEMNRYGKFTYRVSGGNFNKLTLSNAGTALRKASLEKAVINGLITYQQANKYWELTEKNRKKNDEPEDIEPWNERIGEIIDIIKGMGGPERAIQLYPMRVQALLDYAGCSFKTLKYYYYNGK